MDDYGYEGGGSGFLEGSVRTYGKAVRLIQEVWLRVHGSEMPSPSGSPRMRYEEALRLLEEEFRKAKGYQTAQKELHKASGEDPELQQFLEETFDPDGPLPIDMDDVSPNVFKAAAYCHAEQCHDGNEPVDIALDAFLRGVVAELVKDMGWPKRINVGPNRHFPRMLHWMRELEEDTTWDEGTGFHLMNASGRGPVAKAPRAPKDLKVRINPDFI